MPSSSNPARLSRDRAAARRLAVATFLLLVAAACARNPVTGKRELALVSEAQEIQMGQEGAKQVEASMALVPDQALQQYVSQVGMRLARASERPNLPWSFKVVDDPTPNAFALPGGPIYVTRGILALMEDEAELATVLGHEIGHVTARHSVQQMSQQQLAQIGLGVGMILSPQVAQFGDLAAQGLGLLFLKYGRDDERQSDDLGFRYALAQNYDVREQGDIFASLQRISAQSGASGIPSWMSTHPDPGERVQAAERRAAGVNRPLDNTIRNRDTFLARTNGLIYGQNPRDGYFDGGVFYHPELAFRLTFPQGWKTQNTPQAVVAMSPQQDAMLQLTFAQGSAQQAAQQFFGQEGISAGSVSRQAVNGMPAVSGLFEAQTDQGVLRGVAAFLEYGGRTYQLLGYAPAERYAANDAALRQAIGSFARVTDSKVLNAQPNRLDIVKLPQAMTLSEFARRYPSAVDVEELALLNQVPNGSAQLASGSLVKRVVRGSK